MTNTTKEATLAKLVTSSCDYFVSKGRVPHKYKGNGLGANTRDISKELEKFMTSYSIFLKKEKTL